MKANPALTAQLGLVTDAPGASNRQTKWKPERGFGEPKVQCKKSTQVHF